MSDRSGLLLRAAGVAGAVIMLAGSLVLAGWTMNIELLKSSLVPGDIMMLPNTGALFLLGGASLLLRAVSRRYPWARTPSRLIAAFVFSFGLIMFGQRLSGLDFAATRWLFEERLQSYPYRPIGLMAVNSAAAFALLGAALLATNAGTRRAQRLADITAGIALLISATALVGYLYDVKALYELDQFAGMSLPTALGFAVLASGTLLAGVEWGAVRLLIGGDGGAVLARRLLPAALLVPLALGRLWLIARENQWVGRETGVSLFVVMTATIFVWLVLRIALVVRRTDVARERARREAELARGAAEESLHQAEAAQRAAESANVAKSDFLAMMSHELRTPLNAIRGYAELIDMGVRGPVTEAQRADLARIKVSERHLLGLIDDLLNFTRIERGELTYALRPTRVAAAVEEVGTLIAPQMRARPIVYEPASVDSSLFVRADPDRLQQILLNLLSNAVKFSAQGGRVAVRVDAEEHEVRMLVEDEGRGIPADMLDAIFDPFVQVDGGHTRTTSGVGLGLAISRQLARAMHGDLTVESRIGEGSCFTLRLARVREADSAGSGGAHARAGAAPARMPIASGDR
jgi:signal transduction histidine kinase